MWERRQSHKNWGSRTEGLKVVLRLPLPINCWRNSSKIFLPPVQSITGFISLQSSIKRGCGPCSLKVFKQSLGRHLLQNLLVELRRRVGSYGVPSSSIQWFWGKGDGLLTIISKSNFLAKIIGQLGVFYYIRLADRKLEQSYHYYISPLAIPQNLTWGVVKTLPAVSLTYSQIL